MSRQETEKNIESALEKTDVNNIRSESLGIRPTKDDYIYSQCQHWLLVTGLQGMCYFVSRDVKAEMVQVTRDDKYIRELLEEEKKFWQEN